MNADFEAELAAPAAGAFRRPPHLEELNRRLSEHLLWLARPGDALLVAEPWPERLRAEATRRGVELMSPEGTARAGGLIFTPWGWTPSAAAAGERAGASVRPVPFDVVARVNSGGLPRVAAFSQKKGPVAVNEFGAVRYAPRAECYVGLQMDLIERLGGNHSLWLWETSWPLNYDQFNFRFGPDPARHADAESSALIGVIKANWSRNRSDLRRAMETFRAKHR